MRTDAARNRELILSAARELILIQGSEVPLDRIARQAGVSIATFYRRFPERNDLIKAIALEEAHHLLVQIEEGHRAIAAGGGERAWEQCIHAMVTMPNGDLMSTLVAGYSEILAQDATVSATKKDINNAVAGLVKTAKEHHCIRPELDTTEIMVFLLSAVRPLPQLSGKAASKIRNRLIQVVLAGMRPNPNHPITGEAITPEDLPRSPLDTKFHTPPTEPTAGMS